MSETSYTAWDDKLYQWPPPEGWYPAADGKWWPTGYGPGPADPVQTSDAAETSTDPTAATEHASDALGGLSEGAGDALGGVTGSAGDAVGGVGERAGDAFGGVTGSAGDVVGGVGERAGDVFGGVTGSAGDAVGGVGERAGDAFGGVAGSAGDAVGGVGERAGDAFGRVTERPGEGSTGQSEGSAGLLGGVSEGAGDAFGGVTGPVADAVGGVAERAGDAVGGLTGSAGGSLGEVSSPVDDAGGGQEASSTGFSESLGDAPRAAGTDAAAELAETMGFGATGEAGPPPSSDDASGVALDKLDPSDVGVDDTLWASPPAADPVDLGGSFLPGGPPTGADAADADADVGGALPPPPADLADLAAPPPSDPFAPGGALPAPHGADGLTDPPPGFASQLDQGGPGAPGSSDRPPSASSLGPFDETVQMPGDGLPPGAFVPTGQQPDPGPAPPATTAGSFGFEPSAEETLAAPSNGFQTEAGPAEGAPPHGFGQQAPPQGGFSEPVVGGFAAPPGGPSDPGVGPGPGLDWSTPGPTPNDGSMAPPSTWSPSPEGSVPTGPPSQGPVGPDLSSPDRGGSSRWLLVALGVLVLVALGVAAYFLFGRNGGESVESTRPGSIAEPHDRSNGISVTYPSGDEEQEWVITVLEPVRDASAETVSAAPADGSIFAAIRIQVLNQSEIDDAALDDLRFNAVTASGEVIDREGNECSVGDDLDYSAEVGLSQQIVGQVCWEIPAGELDGLLLGIESTEADGRVHVDLS